MPSSPSAVRPLPRVRELYTRFGHLIHELARFGIVGAINVVVDVGIFNALLLGPLDHKPVTAKFISTTIAIVSSYFMNRHWTFRDRARTPLWRELPLFLVLSGVGLGLTLACLAVSHYGLGYTSKLADNVAANVVGLAVSMVWRYWSFKRWVFLAAPDEPREAVQPLQAAARTLD